MESVNSSSITSITFFATRNNLFFASRKQFSGEKLCNSENQGLVFAHVFIISPGTEFKAFNYQKNW